MTDVGWHLPLPLSLSFSRDSYQDIGGNQGVEGGWGGGGSFRDAAVGGPCCNTSPPLFPHTNQRGGGVASLRDATVGLPYCSVLSPSPQPLPPTPQPGMSLHNAAVGGGAAAALSIHISISMTPGAQRGSRQAESGLLQVIGSRLDQEL